MNELVKNDITTLDIIDVNYEGLGVARYNEKVFFVPFAIKNEKVKVKVDYVNKDYYKGHILEILEKSDERVENKCALYPKCGGCQLLHIDYKASLEYKKKSVNDTIKKIGKMEYVINDIIGMDMPYAYRNKVQIPVCDMNGILECGYYMEESHKIIPFKSCLLQSEQISDLVIFLRDECNKYKITGYNEQTKKGCIRHFLIRENYKNELMLVLITNEKKINNIDYLIKDINNNFKNVISIVQNINNKNTNVILGEESKELFGKDEIIDKIGDIYYKISHKSFFQVNRIQATKLYEKVALYVGCNKNVIDAYCGVGSISLALAKDNKKVYGIEVIDKAINDANNNANYNNINNTEFILGKVEDKIEELIKRDQMDCIVVDPPRKGLERSVCECFIKSNIKKIVYVSCNPATLARDLSILKEKYVIVNSCLVDMFPHTNHVETVVALSLKK